MRRLIAFALRQRFFVIGGVLSLVAAGLYSLTHIPFDAFPDLTGTRVEVITSVPGMPPEDVERLVTYPIESSLMGLQGAEGVRSVSKQGLSLIMVSFPIRSMSTSPARWWGNASRMPRGHSPRASKPGSAPSPPRWGSSISTR